MTFAEVTPHGSSYSVATSRADISSSSKSTFPTANTTKPSGTIARSEEVTHLDSTVATGGAVKVISYRITRHDPPNADRIQDVVSGSVDGTRFTLTVNIGVGDVTKTTGPGRAGTLSVKIDHDLATPVADMVTLSASETNVAAYLHGYAAAITKLRGIHQSEGRSDLATLYAAILGEYNRLVAQVLKVIAKTPLAIEKNSMVITSTMDILKYATPPAAFNSAVVAAGCSCSCDCGCCCDCGCGCGCGLCGCDCTCGCCCECGCGCSCGCCA